VTRAAGDGKCPFGTSCFYRHVYRDGTPWTPDLRKVGTAEGGVSVVQVPPLPLATTLCLLPALLRSWITRRAL